MTRNINLALATPDTATESLMDLTAMLATMRPHGYRAEKRFIREWIEPLGVECDAMGNRYKRIGDAPVLWSCHTDTVHKSGGRQFVRVDRYGMIQLAGRSKANCLGADCTTGVWLMREMILARRPGLYVFHRGEECGGIGSSFIADHTPELLEGIKYAIALDRKGTADVITHQGGRCCSNVFAEALADRLNALGNFAYRPDDTGLFTDTANYTSLVPECTNLSVGYYSQHSTKECQDSDFAMSLRSALLELDVSGLPCERDTADDGWLDWPRAFDWNDDFESNIRLTGRKESRELFDDTWGPTFDLEELIRDYPDATARLLESFGVGGADLAEYVYASTGHLRF